MAAIEGGHERRWDDWKNQENLAELELKQIDVQITTADLHRQIAEKELANHEQQIAHAAETEEFLRRKFTNTDLYTWMLSQISALYFQAYKLAYDVAKRAERAYRFERGLDSDFIKFGYWDGVPKGLLAGEGLSLDLKRLEAAYLEQNRREYELSRRVSLVLHDPAALIRLKATGTCEVELPEALFDADYPGHFFRRIKSVSITIPCVTGPYTNVNCTLTLLANRTRALSTGNYPEVPSDERFRYQFVSIQSIATSHGQNDSGLFELNFRDERYLPFEGAGAISRWRIDLPKECNAFDFNTISDVILKVDYTAREGGELLRGKARGALDSALKAPVDQNGVLKPPLRRMFSARHEFSNAWQRFLNSAQEGGSQQLTIDLTMEHFPYQLRNRTLNVDRIDLYLVPKEVRNGTAGNQPPQESVVVNVKYPDAGTATITLSPDDTLVADASTSNRILTDGSQDHTGSPPTGTWLLELPAALPADAVEDLLIVLTYHVAS